MQTSGFIIAPMPPLMFRTPEEGQKQGNTVYPFKAVANRALTRDEGRKARNFCLETFGQGGRMPEPGNRWFGDEQRGYFSFKSETDMTVFIVAMSG